MAVDGSVNFLMQKTCIYIYIYMCVCVCVCVCVCFFVIVRLEVSPLHSVTSRVSERKKMYDVYKAIGGGGGGGVRGEIQNKFDKNLEKF
jgi:hypothetical protein